jgi:hypothetical protein
LWGLHSKLHWRLYLHNWVMKPRRIPVDGDRHELAFAPFRAHREDGLLVGTELPHERTLRAAAGEFRSVRLRGDDAAHGETIGPLMELFRRFLGSKEVFSASQDLQSKMYQGSKENDKAGSHQLPEQALSLSWSFYT